jgi:hypothetical protein
MAAPVPKEQERVWVVSYYGDDPNSEATEIGGIFKTELSARVAVSGIVTIGHKEWACYFPLDFDMVLPIETVEPYTYYLVADEYAEDGKSPFCWTDVDGNRLG